MSRISDEELRTIAKAATQGPWSTMGSCVMASGSCDTYSGNVLGTIAYASSLHETDGEGRSWWTDGAPEANAALIALAPALAAEVLQLRELIERAVRMVPDHQLNWHFDAHRALSTPSPVVAKEGRDA